MEKKQDDPIEMYLNDVLTVPASLAGLPTLSITGGKNVNKLQIGIQMIRKPFDEVSVVAGKLIEDCRGFNELFIEGKTGKWEIVMGLEVHAG